MLDRKLLLVMLVILGIGLNGCCQFLWIFLDILSDLVLNLLEALPEWDSILVAEVDSASKLPAKKTWGGVDGGWIPIFGAVTTLKLCLGLRVLGPIFVLGLIVACGLDREGTNGRRDSRWHRYLDTSQNGRDTRDLSEVRPK